MIRIFARNEVGMSEPLESEEPVKVLRPAGELPLFGTQDNLGPFLLSFDWVFVLKQGMQLSQSSPGPLMEK
jgi:hypothetical protein